MEGSSPLARGTRSLESRERGAPGLIPARAGNTPPAKAVLYKKRAHPRSRGEHRGDYRHGQRVRGSSPLARGTRGGFFCAGVPVGLIPARAGNTRGRIRTLRTGRAHPRSRGEHHMSSSSWCSVVGSSPLARGTPESARQASQQPGLIPARAGNTLPVTRHILVARAHPRSRGEHLGLWKTLKSLVGSSPLARGTPL